MRLADRYQVWPRWTRIAAPVAVVALALGVIGAVSEDIANDAPAEVLGIVVTTIPNSASSAYLERPASEIPPTETPISDEARAPTTTTTAAPTTTTSDCHPSYDPCVPRSSDTDCASGTGNGPVYVNGPVRVIGPDEYGLDADHNGVGCER